MPLQIEKQQEKIFDLVEVNQELHTIADASDGLIFTEGPIWNLTEQTLLFSDIAGNCMYQYKETEGLKKLVEFSFKANGNAYDENDFLITCEHATSRVVKRNQKKKDYEVLCSHYDGKELNSPNDVVVKKDGSIYFTDPSFGRNPSKVGVERPKQLSFQGVYRFYQDRLTLLEASFETPNGLCFSKDETRLFVNDSIKKQIWVFDVLEDGTLSNKILFAETKGEGAGLPDGIKLDEEENMYCCAQGGIHIFDKQGTYLGRILFPVQTANLVFGGVDRKTLYVCATDRVYQLQMKKQGI